ncbi:uncharacterized protein B0H64DRAFT_389277 [Chaetomium fimeti]|uniref:F-box domain-containing protein n=1 Tax=Chaetomium fimeti TaxID=1854472 RepID=A0AAE0HN82_9PEZI|nr:hypothetical protein B0H64DRAFT_389277 [Chaetomium fimeti]
MEHSWRATTVTTATAAQPGSGNHTWSDSPLLRLTARIRHRIYRYLGLATWDSQHPSYGFDLRDGLTAAGTAPHPGDFYGLLLSCRAIYAEAAALLYSANRFILHYAHAHPEPLGPLLALTTSSLASLTSLTIVLNQASCHHPDEYGGYPACCLQGREDDDFDGAYDCKTFHGDVHNVPLLGSTSEGNNAAEGDDDDKVAAAHALQSKWHSAVAHLSSITSGHLELAFVCDIDPHHKRTFEVALSITAPLRLLPPLKDCHIRLCKTPDPRLQQLAQDSALQACGIAPPSSKPSTLSSLTTLPRELRLRILEFTDLIVPSREVTWSRQDQGYMTFSSESSHSPDQRYRRQFFHCWRDDGSGPFIGCFCRRRHSTFSFRCKCWAPPGPVLFLSCRTLYQDAQLVFFSGNRFIIHDYQASPPWELPYVGQTLEERIPKRDYPNNRLAVSQFLREVVPPQCLVYLRFLEVVFPPYPPSAWPQAGHPAIDDWWATVDWLQGKMNAPGLTLRLVGAGVSDWTPDAYSDTITVSEGDTIMRAHMAILRPLTRLANNGLARFYANFVYPWLRTEESRDYNERWDWLQDRKREIKEHAERYVMGDRYEGLYANNREEPERSFWEDFHYNQL